jgi:hypothetical protein
MRPYNKIRAEGSCQISAVERMLTTKEKFMRPALLKSCLLLVVVNFAATVSAQMAKAPHYNPPIRNAPVVRVDGSTRAPEDALLTLTVLAPEHVGLTVREQPSLFWYQSKAAKARFELTIIEKKAISPMLDVKLDAAASDGIRRLRLSDYNVKLTEGVEYRWSVAMVVDPENRSRDLVASGVIKRVELPAALKSRLANEPTTEWPYVFADEGFWYDSLETLSDLIDADPDKKSLREVRAVFFMQVGLNDAARYELLMAGQTKTAAPGH